MKLYGYLGLVSLVAGFGPTTIVSSKTRSTRFQMMPSLVDLDQYNLPLDEIAKEWTASLQVATALTEEGAAYLGAKSSTTVFVDAVKVEFPRGAGLGIALSEIAGGRDDGLGITVISGLVPKEAVSKSVTPSSRLPSTGGHTSQVVHVVAGEQLM